MSKVAIEGNVSGTGTLTIAAPNTNTNRTITLPDATGTLALTGAASDKIEKGDSKVEVTDTGSNGTIVFNTDNAERMRIDSSGNVGINSTSPSTFGDQGTTGGRNVVIQSTGTGRGVLVFASECTGGADEQLGKINFIDSNSTNTNYRGASIAGSRGSNDNSVFLQFATANSGPGVERMRIHAGGGANVGDTTADHFFQATSGFTDRATLMAQATSGSFADHNIFSNVNRNTTNNSYFHLRCRIQGVADKLLIADSGNVTNTNNSYGSISDVKLKQDIVDAGSQWDDIKNLRVRKFHWKSDPDGFMQMGLVAQEAELVSPGLIDEHPDYEEVEVSVFDDEGNPVLNEDGTPQVTRERNALGTTTKAVKYSVLYMKAVKALQEAIERIETLEAKVAALENNNA